MLYAVFAAHSLLCAVFVISFVSKTVRPGSFGAFESTVRELLPARLVRPAALGVVAAECALAVALMVPFTARAAAAGAALLLLVFVLVVARALRGERRPPCRCFGASATPMGSRHLVRNLLLLAVAAGAASAPGSADAGGRPEGLLLAVAGGLVAGWLTTVLDDVIELFRPAPAGRPH